MVRVIATAMRGAKHAFAAPTKAKSDGKTDERDAKADERDVKADERDVKADERDAKIDPDGMTTPMGWKVKIESAMESCVEHQKQMHVWRHKQTLKLEKARQRRARARAAERRREEERRRREDEERRQRRRREEEERKQRRRQRRDEQQVTTHTKPSYLFLKDRL